MAMAAAGALALVLAALEAVVGTALTALVETRQEAEISWLLAMAQRDVAARRRKGGAA